VAYNQAKYLSENGHSVTVITSSIPKTGQKVFEDFNVIRIPVWNIFEDKLGVPYPLFSSRLRRTLRKEIKSADIVHAHGHVYMPSVIAARVAAKHKKPFILTQHNTFIEYKSPALRNMQKLADRLLGKPTLARSAAVITVSEATKDYMNDILPVKTHVHYNGVDVKRFKPVKDQSAVRKALKLPQDKIICFTVRRITFKNGVDTMIEAAKLLKKRPDILFVIGGKGPDLELARGLIKKAKLKNVLLLGMVEDKDLPSYYAASDIFILPSKKGEGFPLVILEALASGLPVIATRSGGHVEIIESSNYGFIVEPNEPAELARYIEVLSNKQTQLATMKHGSRQFAEQNLSWEENVTSLLKVFKEAGA